MDIFNQVKSRCSLTNPQPQVTQRCLNTLSGNGQHSGPDAEKSSTLRRRLLRHNSTVSVPASRDALSDDLPQTSRASARQVLGQSYIHHLAKVNEILIIHMSNTLTK